MFWDHVAWVYDLFADGINRRANRALCEAVEQELSSSDEVLECACGTGLLSAPIAARCKRLVATDFSAPMLRRAQKKCRRFPNASFEQADILHLRFPDASFDAVVAANVLHLLDCPEQALSELNRVCRPGGKLILPTYMNRTESGKTNAVSGAIGKAGADFKRAFTPESYLAFLQRAGFARIRLTVCEGTIPCAVAVIQKQAGEEAI